MHPTSLIILGQQQAQIVWCKEVILPGIGFCIVEFTSTDRMFLPVAIGAGLMKGAIEQVGQFMDRR